MRRFLLFLSLTCALLSARDYGPALGSKLPAFRLSDQDGKVHSLKSVMGPKGAVIVFFRSADW